MLKSVPLAQREAAYALGRRASRQFQRALLRPHRHRRRYDARLRPRARRDDGGDDGDWQQPAGVGVLFAPQYTMAAVIANEFTEAADELYLHALIEIGLVLFIITLIVNGLSRLLIWSMSRSAARARGAGARTFSRGGAGMTAFHVAPQTLHLFVAFWRAVLLALLPLAMILFFVVSRGSAHSISSSSPTCPRRLANQAAA